MPLKDLLFSFEGRIRRRDWWLWGIGVGLAWSVVSSALAGAVFGMSLTTSLLGGSGLPGSWSFTGFSLAAFLPVLWVQAALSAKRAHDRNNDALIAVSLTILAGMITFVPEVVDLVTRFSLTDRQFDTLYRATSLGTVAVNFYLLVVLGILDGTPGPNRFGRSPKGIGGEPADTAAEVFS